MIGISFDTDWQDGEVLQFTLDLLKKYHIKATFFCTDKTKVKIKGHEIAIHPNFASKDSPAMIIKKLKKDFPSSRGLRSHGIATSNEIILRAQKEKIKYQSNYLMYLKKNIEPIKIYKMTELPIYWMDYYYLATEKHPRFRLKDFKLNQPGLKIFDFHPIHLYLNTISLKQYLKCKKDPKNQRKYINENKPGIKTLLTTLLEEIGPGDYRLKTL